MADQSGGCLLLGRNLFILCADSSYEGWCSAVVYRTGGLQLGSIGMALLSAVFVEELYKDFYTNL